MGKLENERKLKAQLISDCVARISSRFTSAVGVVTGTFPRPYRTNPTNAASGDSPSWVASV